MFNLPHRPLTTAYQLPTTIPAFTLIELLVVIVIIGIIAVISAPEYLRFKQKIDLNGSVQLLQTGLNEGYSLARSRSQNYKVLGSAGDNFFTLQACDNYDCTIAGINTETRELEGATTLSPDFEIYFIAPHGDMTIATPDGDALTLTLDNNGLTQTLQANALSGLVTTDTP